MRHEKRKKKLWIAAGVLTAAVVGGIAVFYRLYGFSDHLTEAETGLARRVEPAVDMIESRAKDYFSLDENAADLRWYDCANLTEEETQKLLTCIPNVTFNEETVFPDTVAEALQPEALLENGKNPGLGVRALHEKGITGKGVGIAIIDQVLYTGHPEYASRLKLYEEIHVLSGQDGSMHGAALASLSAGQSCGVAPEADLYYWAFDNFKNVFGGDAPDNIDWEGYARAIDRVIEVNEGLPEEEKIRVIAIARGYYFTGDEKTDERLRSMLDAVERAGNAGIFVVTTSTELNYEFFEKYETRLPFAGLGKIFPGGDAETVENYTLGGWQWSFAEELSHTLLVPMDDRTTADMSGDTYVYYADGGWSWVVPYVAGAYALCAQAEPDITPERFFVGAMETADVITRVREEDGAEFNLHVLNLQRLLEELDAGGHR